MNNAMYDREQWLAAYARFVQAPQTLTDEDVAQLALTSDNLGERARAARAGFVPAQTDEQKELESRTLTLGLFLEQMTELTDSLTTFAYQSRAAHSRLEALEQRITAIEAKPHVKFCGVWKTGGTYRRGDAATHHGSLWICQSETAGEPSQDYVGWTLAVKRGQA